MPRLVVDLNRYRNVLYGCVKHTDDCLRNNGDLIHDSDEDDRRYDIKSCNQPELDDGGTTLYVHGSYFDGDHHAFCHAYKDEEEAEHAEAMFIALIERFNAEDYEAKEDKEEDSSEDMPF